MRKEKSLPSLCHCILRPLYLSPKTWERNWEDFLKCAYIDFPPARNPASLFPTGFKILESKTLSRYLFNGWLRVSCHFSSQSQWKESTFTHLPYSCTVLILQSCPTFCHPTDCNPPGTSVHGDSPGEKTGVGSLSLLQGISPPRNWTGVSRVAGRFFTSWATREALPYFQRWPIVQILCNMHQDQRKIRKL